MKKTNQEPPILCWGCCYPTKQVEDIKNDIGASPERWGLRLPDHAHNNGGRGQGEFQALVAVPTGYAKHVAEVAQAAAKAVPSKNAAVKVFAVHRI